MAPIAICFCGEFRTALHAAPAIKAWIGSLWDKVDIFIHTWDKNTYKHYQASLNLILEQLTGQGLAQKHDEHLVRPVGAEEIDQLRNFYQPKILKVDLCERPYLSLYRSFSSCMKEINSWSAARGSLYNFVIKLRLDMSYPLQDLYLDPFTRQHRVRPSSLEAEYDLFLGNSSLFRHNGPDNQIIREEIWSGSQPVMTKAAEFCSRAEQVPGLSFAEHLGLEQINMGPTHNTHFAPHRVIITGLDSLDWLGIFYMEEMLNNINFLHRLNNEYSEQLCEFIRDRVRSSGIHSLYPEIYREVLI